MAKVSSPSQHAIDYYTARKEVNTQLSPSHIKRLMLDVGSGKWPHIRSDEFGTIPKNPTSLHGKAAKDIAQTKGQYARHVSRAGSEKGYDYYHDSKQSNLPGNISRSQYLDQLRFSASDSMLRRMESNYANACEKYEKYYNDVTGSGSYNKQFYVGPSKGDYERNLKVEIARIKHEEFSEKRRLVSQEIATRERVYTKRNNEKEK